MVVLSTVLSTGRPALALLARRAYRLAGAALSPLREEQPLQEEPVTALSSNPGALEYTVHESDLFAATRPRCDVLVHGSVRPARGPVKMLDTGVKIGAARTVVRVWGERSIRMDTRGHLRFTDPEPFDVMPLTWDNAYGGRDSHAEARLFPPVKPRLGRPPGDERPRIVGYPRNASGRGFFLDLDRDRLDGARAPSLEDPEDPVTPDRLLARGPLDWLDRPAAACYSPLDIATFPRAAFFAAPAADPPSRPVREVALGALRESDLAGRDLLRPKLDVRASQTAPPGLSVAITSRIRIALWNLWPGREVLDVEVPPEVPQLVLEPPGCPPVELPPLLRTVLFDIDAERVVFVWAGLLEVAAPYPGAMCASMRRAVRWDRR